MDDLIELNLFVDSLKTKITELSLDLTVRLCSPDDFLGEHFIDLMINDRVVYTIAYRKEFGFGFYRETGVFGENPDEILFYEDALCKVFALIKSL